MDIGVPVRVALPNVFGMGMGSGMFRYVLLVLARVLCCERASYCYRYVICILLDLHSYNQAWGCIVYYVQDLGLGIYLFAKLRRRL